jgi:hypothetical protein
MRCEPGRLAVRKLDAALGVPEELIRYAPGFLNQPIQFHSCFISYSHKDKAFARLLYDRLQGQGIRCWLDDHQRLPGQDTYYEIDRGIRLWDKVLLCASKASLANWWVAIPPRAKNSHRQGRAGPSLETQPPVGYLG